MKVGLEEIKKGKELALTQTQNAVINARKNLNLLEQRVVGLLGQIELLNELINEPNSDAENIKDMGDK